MRGATSRKKGSTQHYRKISIHAPHARSDCKVRPTDAIHRHFNPRSSCEERLCRSSHTCPSRRISIHAPHARSDYRMALALFSISQFQSTLLMRGATLPPAVQLERYLISIHAPHARSDTLNGVGAISEVKFQSTLLMRGATCDDGFRDVFAAISIHAPHARSDRRTGQCSRHDAISIHAPHARSDIVEDLACPLSKGFQSTLLMRGATPRRPGRRASRRSYFNPRSSCEERHLLRQAPAVTLWISIHAPHARSDELTPK